MVCNENIQIDQKVIAQNAQSIKQAMIVMRKNAFAFQQILNNQEIAVTLLFSYLFKFNPNHQSSLNLQYRSYSFQF